MVTWRRNPVLQNPQHDAKGNLTHDAGVADQLYHFRRRALDPVAGRWLQRDPLGYIDSLNLHEYLGSNPITNVDPLGEVIETGWDIFSIGVGVVTTGYDILKWFTCERTEEDLFVGHSAKFV